MANALVTPGVFVAVAIILAILFAIGLGWCRCRCRKKRIADIEEGDPPQDMQHSAWSQDLGNCAECRVDY